MLSGILRWSTVSNVILIAGTFLTFVFYGQAFVTHPTVWVPILCTAAGWLFGILIHEIGHAVAAIACGWQILAFQVYPVGWHGPSCTLTLLPRSVGKEAGGYVVIVPRSLATGSATRWMTILASGPGASLALAATALIFRETWLRGVDTPGLIASNFGLAIAIQSCVFAAISLIPQGGSDGAHIIAMARRDPEKDAIWPYVWARTMLDFNLRLRDLPGWLLAAQRDLPFPEKEREQYLAGLEIGLALDAEVPDYSRARALIDSHLVHYGASAWLASCDAYLAAIGEGDAEGAARRLWSGEPDRQVMAMQHAAKASVLAVQGDRRGMRAELLRMRKANRADCPYRNATFRDIERRIRAALRPA